MEHILNHSKRFFPCRARCVSRSAGRCRWATSSSWTLTQLLCVLNSSVSYLQGTLRVAVGRPLQMGDIVILDFDATRADEGEPILGAKRAGLRLDTETADLEFLPGATTASRPRMIVPLFLRGANSSTVDSRGLSVQVPAAEGRCADVGT